MPLFSPAAPPTPARGFRKPGGKPLPPRLIALAVFLVPLGLTLYAWLQQRQSEAQEHAAAFSLEASRAAAAIEERLNDYAQVLRGGSGFFSANPAAGRAQWRQFNQRLEVERHVPGMYRLGYAARLSPDELPAFVQRRRHSDGFDQFAIQPPGLREQYFPVTYLEPESNAAPALGFDLGSDPSRMAALAMARDSDTPALSGPIQLLSDTSGREGPGLLMASPVYQAGAVTGTTHERQKALTGFVFTVFRIQDFVAALPALHNSRLAIALSDVSGDLPTPLLGRIDANPVEQRSINFGGRSWRLEMAEQYTDSGYGKLPASTLILAAGVAISLLLARLTLFLSSRKEQAENLARRMSSEWEEANTRLRSIFGALPDLMIELDKERRCRQIHAPQEENLLGEPQNMVGHRWGELFPPSLARQLDEACDGIDRGEGLGLLNYQLPRSDGEICDYEARITGIGAEGYLVVIRNISDYRSAQQALVVANRKLQAIFDSATEVAILVSDTRGTLTAFNRGAEKMLGYSAEQLVGRQSPVLLHQADEIEARGAELSQEFGWKVEGFDVLVTAARLSGAERREWTYVRQDGSRLAVSLVITAVYDEADNVVGFLGIAVDISALKQAEAELRRHRDHLQELVSERSADLILAKEAAEHANQAKSEFLANMSHELRTPMHAILSFAQLGAERSAGQGEAEKLRHYFLRIRESGDRLLSLVNDLLDLSKLEAGKMSFAPCPTDLLPLIHEAILELEPLLQEKHLKLSVLEHSLPLVHADPLRFSQLIRNLLSNAIKFSPLGGIIQVRFSPAWLEAGDDRNGRQQPALSVSVCDEGVGIPVAERELVFEKFSQSSSTKTGAGGTGLGLSICREIVQAHRGTIVATANDGPGACLIFTLPLAGSRPPLEETP